MLTGGAGTNIFKFAATNTATASTVNFDTITDWRAGTNTIDYTAVTLVAATGANAQITLAAGGVATFDLSLSSLSQRLTAVLAFANTNGAGTSTIWQQGSDAYIFMSNVATTTVGDVLVKLTGVTVGASGLAFSGGDITGIG